MRSLASLEPLFKPLLQTLKEWFSALSAAIAASKDAFFSVSQTACVDLHKKREIHAKTKKKGAALRRANARAPE